jgi:hypothetical protein
MPRFKDWDFENNEYKNGKWYGWEKDHLTTFHRLGEPYEKFCVGSCPYDGMTLKTAQSFDAFLNLTENRMYSGSTFRPRPDTKYFWIPIKEIWPWGYKAFFRTKLILDDMFENKKSAYIHCHAGSNRSPCMTVAWLTSRGHSLDEACNLLCSSMDWPEERKMESARLLKGRFLFNIELGDIPDHLDEFYKRYAEVGPNLEKILKKDPPLVMQKHSAHS